MFLWPWQDFHECINFGGVGVLFLFLLLAVSETVFAIWQDEMKNAEAVKKGKG